MPLQITFHQLPVSAALETDIRQLAADLEGVYPGIVSCRIRVEAPHRHQSQGRLYKIAIELGVPGDRLMVNRAPDEHTAHEDVYVAVRDAFRAARRQLEDYARRRRGDVKAHQPLPS